MGNNRRYFSREETAGKKENAKFTSSGGRLESELVPRMYGQGARREADGRPVSH